MFDILLQKRMFRKGKKYQREKDKMSHYIVMNDKNVKYFSVLSEVVEVENKYFVCQILHLYLLFMKDCFQVDLLQCRI